jgi:hypothetical protein
LRARRVVRGAPKAFAWIRFSGVVVNQADQITPAGHSRELTADSPQRQRESATQHTGGTPSVYGLGCGVGAEVQGAPYGETLQATGRTTRILNRPKRVCADSLPANSAASAFIPPESALPWRAPQPTMGLETSLAIGATCPTGRRKRSERCPCNLALASWGKALGLHGQSLPGRRIGIVPARTGDRDLRLARRRRRAATLRAWGCTRCGGPTSPGGRRWEGAASKPARSPATPTAR